MKWLQDRLPTGLVPDAKEWMHWWSIRWLIVAAFCWGAAMAYEWMPERWLPDLPDFLEKGLGVGAIVSMGMSAVGRVVQQPCKHHDHKP